MTLNERLKARRLALGMSQEDLAQRAGVKQSKISAWESGRHQPRADTIIMLAGALNVSTDWLLGLTEELNERP